MQAQVRNGVSIRMAALYLLLSGDTREPAIHATPTHTTSAENNSAHFTKESH